MNTQEGLGPVVAGVDRSAENAEVVAYAAWEAQHRGVALRLVHAVQVSSMSADPAGPHHDDNVLLVSAEEQLAESVSWVRPGYPDLTVDTKVVAGSGAAVLVAESESASLVVVGSRGDGGFAGLLVGSVAAQVSTHARCPVLVVRRPESGVEVPGAGPLVVGVDCTPGSDEVLRFAFDEAALRGVPLVAVHVWSVPEMSARSVGTVWSRDFATAGLQLRELTGQILAEAVSGWQEKFPQVEVVRRSVHGDEPARVLLEVAQEVEADLVLVGTRPRDATTAIPFSSVAQTVVAHAPASVAVIHAGRG